MQNTDEHLPWYMRELGLKGTRRKGDVSPESRASFFFAFGVTPDEQVCLERYYDSMSISTQSGEWHPRDVFPCII